MGNFFKKGLIVVLICLLIYFIYFFTSKCLKVIFPKLNPSKCPQNYEITNCGNNITCCKLKNFSKLGLEKDLNQYFINLKDKNKCNKEEIILSTGSHWNPNTPMDDVIKKELCNWSKKGKSCLVPWDSITNGLDNNNNPYC